MRIVHILTRFLRAGSEENTTLTCLTQARLGHDVHLLHGDQYHPLSIARLDGAVEVRKISSLVHPVDPLRDAAALDALVRRFRALRPDLVHTHQSKAGVLARIAAMLAGVPLVAHGVHIVPFENASPAAAAVYLACERVCGRFTDLFVHVGPSSLAQYARLGIGRDALHVVAESGMDVERFRRAPPPPDILALLGPGAGRRFAILSLAALEPRKRVREFLPVFCKIVERYPQAVLLIAGEGPERAAIAAEIAARGLGAHVHMLGFRDDPEKLLAAADALVVCSVREGLPRAAVQARIAGVPIVSVDLPEMAAVVRHGETGFIVPADDLDAMSGVFEMLMADPALCERLRRAGGAFDASPWDAATMTAKIDAAYAAASARKSHHFTSA